MSNAPWSFDEARDACRTSSQAQAAAEEALREAAKEQAAAEAAYRVALAKRIVELHAEGTAWSACADLARGDKAVADLRFRRDVAEGVREASVHAAWRRNADRRDTAMFATWSMRRNLAEGFEDGEEPSWTPSIAGGSRG